jgi:hypothetical protein
MYKRFFGYVFLWVRYLYNEKHIFKFNLYEI